MGACSSQDWPLGGTVDPLTEPEFSPLLSFSTWWGQTPLEVAPGAEASSLALGSSLLSPGKSVIP